MDDEVSGSIAAVCDVLLADRPSVGVQAFGQVVEDELQSIIRDMSRMVVDVAHEIRDVGRVVDPLVQGELAVADRHGLVFGLRGKGGGERALGGRETIPILRHRRHQERADETAQRQHYPLHSHLPRRVPEPAKITRYRDYAQTVRSPKSRLMSHSGIMRLAQAALLLSRGQRRLGAIMSSAGMAVAERIDA